MYSNEILDLLMGYVFFVSSRFSVLGQMSTGIEAI